MSIFYPARATLTPDGWREGHGVLVEQGRIAAILVCAPTGIEVARLPPEALLVPGFIDAQVNGGGGVLFNDDPTPRGARQIAAAHRQLGATGILPTLITSAPETLHAAAQAMPRALGEGVLGVHVEGPFISPEKPGVHRPDFIRAPDAADIALLCALAESLGAPVLLTLAPECVSLADQRRLAAAGVILSAGHCAPAVEQIGPEISGFTHCFNAMPPISARSPGVAAAALVPGRVTGVIADGIHVHEALLNLLLRAKPVGEIMLVSDAMSVAGTDLAGFDLQGRRILRADGRLQTEDGVLAGADLTLPQAVRQMARLGMRREDAIASASTVPAIFLRIDGARGRLVPGLAADITILDEGLELIGTVLAGFYQPA